VTYVDLHLHLLPGVDDGPPDLDASLVHAARMAAEGVHVATVTPHVAHPDMRVEVAAIPARTRALQAALDDAGIDLRLHPGGEIFPDGAAQLGPAELEIVAHGPPGARWVLLEVPFDGIDATFLDACRHVTDHRFGLLIAHPERADGLLDEGLRRLAPVIAQGALLEVNVCSLLGMHGPEAQHAGEQLVADGSAFLLASDGHGGTRGHTLAAGVEAAIRAGASPRRARELTSANPRALLHRGMPAAGARRAAA
jgi:protein-tyrosine phosphatase